MPVHPGKILIIAGIVLIAAGIFTIFWGKTPIGRLPGDIHVQKENFSLYFPITTSIIISLILTAIFIFWGKK